VHRTDDVVYGGLGNDHLYGGRAARRLYGGPGDDVVTSCTPDDDDGCYGDALLFYGAGGRDRLYGGDGPDWMYGSDGADTLIGSGDEGRDTLPGGPGRDAGKWDSGPPWMRDTVQSVERRLR
jgi:Ca2+-binding RTX toxin-like protein